MSWKVIGCPRCGRALDIHRGWRHAGATGRCLKCGKFYDDAVEQRVQQALAAPELAARRERESWPRRIGAVLLLLYGGFSLIAAFFAVYTIGDGFHSVRHPLDVAEKWLETALITAAGLWVLRGSRDAAESSLRHEHESRTGLAPFEMG